MNELFHSIVSKATEKKILFYDVLHLLIHSILCINNTWKSVVYAQAKEVFKIIIIHDQE